MAGHGERREHEVRGERGHLVGVHVEVAPHPGQVRQGLDRPIRVAVDPDQVVTEAKGAQDLSVGAGEGDDAHLGSLSPLTLARWG